MELRIVNSSQGEEKLLADGKVAAVITNDGGRWIAREACRHPVSGVDYIVGDQAVNVTKYHNDPNGAQMIYDALWG